MSSLKYHLCPETPPTDFSVETIGALALSLFFPASPDLHSSEVQITTLRGNNIYNLVIHPSDWLF